MHEIRPATLTDIEPIIAMQRQIHAEHLAWDAARWTIQTPIDQAYRDWIANLIASANGGLTLIAKDSEKLVGYLIAEIEGESTKHWSPRAVYLHDLFVDASSRRAGVARLLMERLLEWSASSHPSLQVRLMTAIRNESARAFFERFGFRSCVVEMLRDGTAKGEGSRD